MKGLTFYDKQHIQKVLAQQNDVANIFNRFILSITPYLRQWDDRGGNSVWVRNQSVEKRIDNELMNLASQLMANISLFQIDAWKRSDAKNDDFIRKYIEGMSINTAAKEGMFAHNLTALAQLQNDFDARGNKLSTSVWNLADQTKTQLEYYLKTGLSTGQNAARISQDVRQILNEPDKRFRRIRNDKGELVLSQPMKDYHPSEKYGPGVYRSAKMNALRLTATTTNMAYRSADYDRWSKQDFVLGIQIQRSANNRGPCKLCDSMVGEYPKTFKFTGFHPFCTCIATPIVMKPEELADFLLDDTIPQDKVIKDIPKEAKDWVESQRERAKGWLNTPYFIQDNESFFGKFESNTYTPDEKKFTRARKTQTAMDRAINFFSKEYPEIPNTELAAIHHYTKKGGNYRQLNKQLFEDKLTDFNAASSELISKGLDKLTIFEGTVYRGSIMKNKMFNELYSNRDVTHHIFTSSTVDREVANEHFTKYRIPKKNEIKVLFEIKSKNGRDISSVSEFNGKFDNENQKEVLFDKGTKFNILSVRDKDDYKIVKLEEI